MHRGTPCIFSIYLTISYIPSILFKIDKRILEESIIQFLKFLALWSKLLKNILGIHLTISCIPIIMFKIAKNILGIYLILSYITIMFKIVKDILGIIFHISYFYSTTKHEIIQITNHNLLCSLDPPNQSWLF